MINRKVWFAVAIIAGTLLVILIGAVVLWPSPAIAEASIQSSSVGLFGAPYCITGEANIVGPVVNFALVQSVTGGIIHADYVEWSPETDAKARIYIDNTIQVIAYGTLQDVTYWIEQEKLDTSLREQLNDLIDNGAIDPSSALSGTIHTSRELAGYWKNWEWARTDDSDFILTVTSTDFRNIRLSIECTPWSSSVGNAMTLALLVDDQLVAEMDAGGYSAGSYVNRVLAGLEPGTHVLRVQMDVRYGCDYYIWLTTWTGDDASTSVGPSSQRSFTPSPGTGLAMKDAYPGTNRPGGTTSVTVAFDLPNAEKANITDRYLTNFTLTSSLTITKYNGSSVVSTDLVSITPSKDDGYQRFTIYYTDAPGILNSLAPDEWLTIEYDLRTPSTTGVYTLPEATIEYTPLP